MGLRTVLLTGGLGYIGSHTAVELAESGCRIVLLDNLANSSRSVLDGVAAILGKIPTFYHLDVRNQEGVEEVLRREGVGTVVHFAGRKAVDESINKPLEYFDCNFSGSLSLLQAMANSGVYNLVFSSSATVYGVPEFLPLDETHATIPVNPYGRSKLYVEKVLEDLARSDARWRIISLRYFNPVGAHHSALIGDNPRGSPSNLMPYIARVASGQLQNLNVFGDDYDTPDGTGVRDYLHVVDLAEGHVAALLKLGDRGFNYRTLNLGTGVGYSVLEVIRAFERTNNVSVPYMIAPRRPGDLPVCYANPSLACEVLGWRARRGIDAMCSSSWAFQKRSTIKI